MKAVVMAGGFGTRIQPLTHSIPKPMLPIMNRPMMEHTIVSLRDLGITEFIVLLYFKPDVIKDYFGDGSKWGIKITYVTPDDDYGTAGAVKKAAEFIGDENFIIISGDLVTNFDFQKIFDYHASKNSKLTITLTSVDNPLEFGVVIANDDGVIEKFLEKPSWGEVFSDTINTGIYIIEPEILNHIPNNENFDFAKDLFPSLMKKGITLYAGHAEGYWRDVGNPESYRDVYDDILSGTIDIKLSSKEQKYPDGIMLCDGDNCDIEEGVEIIGTVMIGSNVTIKRGSKLNNVVIGSNVTIGDGARISNTVIWDSVEIDKNARLDGCVICNNNTLGKNVSAKSGLILAEGCEIGELVLIEKDVTIWPDKKIEDAAIVSSSVILGSKYKNSIFENGVVIGKSNVEISCEMSTKLAEAFGAQLPVGSTVVVSRDNSKGSQMLKRAFLGGLLSAGINVVDFRSVPAAVMRCSLSYHDYYDGGVYFNQKLDDPTSVVITFYNHEALRINSDMSKKIEKAFFKENFRRVDYSRIGALSVRDHSAEYEGYKKGMEELLTSHMFKCVDCRIAVDMMHGQAAEIFPDILRDLGIDNIIFNAYSDAHRLENINALIKRSHEDMGSVVKSMKLDAGFMIYPYGQYIDIICDEGVVLSKQTSLLVVLTLMDLDAKERGERKKVFLPTWAADFVDFNSLDIERGQYANFKKDKMKQYDLITTGEGNFAFPEFSTHRDSMYATLKILELIVEHNVKLSEVIESLPKFYYHTTKIACTQANKGKMMRMFLEDAKDKKSSTLDGVKIWLDESDWILMIPDQYSDHLNIYIQAKDEIRGGAILELYGAKIASWMSA